MRLHGTNGARSMQDHTQEEIDSRSEPSPMAVELHKPANARLGTKSEKVMRF